LARSMYEVNEESLEQLRRAIRSGRLSHSHVYPDTHQLPLGVAIRHGNVAACRLLLEVGADPNRESALDTSPAWAAVRALHGEGLPAGVDAPSRRVVKAVLELLCESGGTLDAASPAFVSKPHAAYPSLCRSALHYAVRASDHGTVRVLSALGVNLDEVVIDDEAGGIPLDALVRACRTGDQTMMVTLLRSGASDRSLASASSGYGPVIGCVLGGYEQVFEYYVRERGADVAQRWEGRTLLQLAKTQVMRERIRALKTDLSVAGAVNVYPELPRNGGAQTIMSGQAEPRRSASVSPL
jgi:hypothetical protein